MKIGMGYDIHALSEGRKMVLGGIEIPHQKGPVGHSDGDIVLHAICDALLGAMAKGDIGRLFPDNDPEYKDIDSKKLLEEVVAIMKDEGLKVSNIDINVIAEEPKISEYQQDMSKTISEILEISSDNVSIKGKTAEKMGSVGKGEAIEAYAVVLLVEASEK